MKILLSTLVLLSASLAFACDDAAVRGSGNLVAENYEFEGFTKVEIANTFRADISRSDTFSVSVEADDNILELIEVTQDGDTLRLQLESGTTVTSATLQATIRMPEIESLDVSGASRATIAGFENADSLQARVSGASSASLEGGGTEADLNASGASTLDLEDLLLEISHVTLSGASNGTVNVRDELGPVDASGASRLRYIGTPNLTGVDISGASQVEPAE